MPEPFAQRAGRGFLGGDAPEQGGDHGDRPVPDPQALQGVKYTGEHGDTGEHAGQGQLGEVHTRNPPCSNRRESWSMRSPSTLMRSRRA